MNVHDFRKPGQEQKHAPLVGISVSTYADKNIPPREFLDGADLFPARNVVLLSGDGGVGKSLLALQLALCISTAIRWLDIEVASGPVVYLSAEDDEMEVANRVKEIASADNIDLHDAASLVMLYMAGEDATLGFEDRSNGSVKRTELYERLHATLDWYSPVLLILDNLADVFAGNENNRSAVKHFIGLLRRLAVQHDCVVMLLAHPSLAGMASGSGLSGSTAWNNSARSRLYLRRDTDGTGHEADKTVRVLETMKANYGPMGSTIDLRWENGRFVRKARPNAFDNVGVSHLEKVAKIFGEGDYRVSERSETWGGYVVADVLHLDIGRGISADARTREQQLARDRIKIVLGKWSSTPGSGIRIVSKPDEFRKPKDFYGT
jgi:RecA-family ATPase